MNTNIESVKRLINCAKYVVLACILIITITAYQNKFYDMALLLAPIAGVIMYAATIWQLKTNKKWLSAIPSVLWMILGSQSAMFGGLLWGLPQMISIGFLFHFLMLWVSGDAVISWLESEHS